MTETAEQWLARTHPGAEPLPDPDHGRHPRQVRFTDRSAYWGADQDLIDRPGVHRQPADARRQAILTHGAEVVELDEARRVKRQAATAKAPCRHCGARPERSKKRGLCGSCDQYQLRTGELPALDVLGRRAA